jgi:hypothetical protein
LLIAPLGEELAKATTPLISRELFTALDFATAGDYYEDNWYPPLGSLEIVMVG